MNLAINRFASQFLLAALVLSQLGVSDAFAADKKTASTGALKGSISSSALTVATALHDIHIAADHLQHVTTDMINEIERQQQVAVAEPDVIGPIVVPAMPAPTGMISMGPLLPPREKWIKLYMWQYSQLLPMLVSEINSTQVPADQQALIESKWQQMVPLVNDINAHYEKLVSITKAPPYENLAIGKELLPIHDDLKKLQEIQKEIWRLSKKS